MIENTIIDLFRDAIKEKSQSITFIYGRNSEKTVSYTELFYTSKRVLKNLQEAGIQKGDEVIIMLSSNEHFLYTFMACLLGGFIAIPLDTTATEANLDRLLKICQQISRCTTVTEKRILADFKNLEEDSETTQVLQKVEDHTLYYHDMDLEAEFGVVETIVKYDIALVQYSSGSTGNPKGVILTHENLLSNIQAIISAFRQNADDVYLSWLPLHHDLGLIWLCLIPILTNVKQYNMDISLFLKEPLLWLDKASQKQATILASPNFGYKYLLQHLDEKMEYGWNLEHVRSILNGAEPISNHVVREFNSKLAKYKLNDNAMLPIYGLAESTLIVSVSVSGEGVRSVRLSRDFLSVGDEIAHVNVQEKSIELVAVGRIVEDVEVRITDRNHIALPAEYIGQIEIRGKSVTKGYYKEKAEERIRYMTEDGWLNTGDIGFWTEDNLFIATRQKDIIIIDGKNLYFADIEQVLEHLEEVPQSGIISCAYQSEENEDILLLFVKWEAIDQRFAVMYQAVQKALAKEFGILRFKMLPIDEIPKTSSGKLKRYQVAEIYRDMTESEKNHVDKTLAREVERLEKQLSRENITQNAESDVLLCHVTKQLKNLMTQMFEGKELSESDNFFALGADSIVLKRITEELIETYGEAVLPSSVYKYPTISQLAIYLNGLAEDSKEYGAQRNRQQVEDTSESYFELSGQQKRMYLLSYLNKNSANYNISLVWELDGELDIQRLEKSFQELVERHESLRTTFHFIDGKPMQKVHTAHPFKIIEMEASENEDLNATIANAMKTFDLGRVPLVQVSVIAVDAVKHILFFDMHHIIGDGASARILLDELASLYVGEPLLPLEMQYRDYVQFQKCYKESKRYQEDQAFWSNMYEKKPFERELHTDYKRTEELKQSGGKMYESVRADVLQELKAYSRKSNRTLFMVLFASFSIVLSEYYDEDDLAIGIPYMGRPEKRFEKVVGIFVNTLAIRLKIQENLTFEAYLTYVKDVYVECLNHVEYQFNDLVEDLHCNRQTNRNPVFDVFFALQNINPDQLSLSGLTTQKRKASNKLTRFDLSIDLFEEETLDCVIEYRDSLWREDTIRELFQRYHDVLDTISRNPDIKVKDLRKSKKKVAGKKKNLGFHFKGLK